MVLASFLMHCIIGPAVNVLLLFRQQECNLACLADRATVRCFTLCSISANRAYIILDILARSVSQLVKCLFIQCSMDLLDFVREVEGSEGFFVALCRSISDHAGIHLQKLIGFSIDSFAQVFRR